MIYSPTLLGMGAYVPEAVVTNFDLSKRVDTSDEWIVSRTGIKQRHYLAPGETTSDMCLHAAQRALAQAGLASSDLTHLLVATCTPDSYCPSTACTLSAKLGCHGVFALDINAVCSGFVYGVSLVRDILGGNQTAKILLVGADGLSTRLNWEDRGTCVLFGDGAGAAVFSVETAAKLAPGNAVVRDVRIHSDGSLGRLLHIDGGGTSAPYALGDTVGPEYFVRMEGREVFKHAVRNMTAICRETLEANGLAVADVDLFIPHQANLRIIEAVGEKLGVDSSRVFVNVDTHGNTSAASIPIAMTEALEKGRIRPGMRVLVSTFGGGLSWGAALLDF